MGKLEYGNEKIMTEDNINIDIRNDFNQIFGIINYHRQRVSKTIDEESFSNKNSANNSQSMPIELTQIHTDEFVPFEMAQIPVILFSTGWTNHQIIISRCKSDNERLFYILAVLYNAALRNIANI